MNRTIRMTPMLMVTSRVILALLLLLLILAPVAALAQPPQVDFLSASAPTVNIQTITARAVNPASVGQGTPIYYWVVARYPIGLSIPAGPVVATGTVGLQNLTGTNYVNISWSPTPGATGYDVLHSATAVYPGSCASCAVVLNTGSTSVNDQSSGGSAYPPGGLATNAAAVGSIYLNNRDYSIPVPFLNVNANAFRLGYFTGAFAANDCVRINANGQLESAGAACGTGSGNAYGCATTVGGSIVTVASTPVDCRGQVDNVTSKLAADAAWTATGGTGVVYIYWSTDGIGTGQITMGMFSVTGTCNANCTAVTLLSSGFPSNKGAQLVGTVTVTAGVPGAFVDYRGIYKSTALLAGANITLAPQADGSTMVTAAGGSSPISSLVENDFCRRGDAGVWPAYIGNWAWVAQSFSGGGEAESNIASSRAGCGMSTTTTAGANDFRMYRPSNNNTPDMNITTFAATSLKVTWKWTTDAVDIANERVVMRHGQPYTGAPTVNESNSIGFLRDTGTAAGNIIFQICTGGVCTNTDTAVTYDLATSYRMTWTTTTNGTFNWQVDKWVGNGAMTTTTGVVVNTNPSGNLMPIAGLMTLAAAAKSTTFHYYRKELVE